MTTSETTTNETDTFDLAATIEDLREVFYRHVAANCDQGGEIFPDN